MRKFVVIKRAGARGEVLRVVDRRPEEVGDGAIVVAVPIGRVARVGDTVELGEWGQITTIWTYAHGHKCPCGSPAPCASGDVVYCAAVAVCDVHRPRFNAILEEEGAATTAARDYLGVPSLRAGRLYNQAAGGTPAERALRRLATEVYRG